MQPTGRVARCTRVDGDTEIYVKHRDEMLRYATALVGPTDADDVVSVVVLRSLRGRSLTGLENPRAYLLKAVLNECRGVWRRKPAEPLPDLPTAEVPAELMDVLAAVWRLPVRQRAAVYLFYWEGLPTAEIAEVMGLGTGTVKRYLHLARNRLRGVLS